MVGTMGPDHPSGNINTRAQRRSEELRLHAYTRSRKLRSISPPLIISRYMKHRQWQREKNGGKGTERKRSRGTMYPREVTYPFASIFRLFLFGDELLGPSLQPRCHRRRRRRHPPNSLRLQRTHTLGANRWSCAPR
jgi:hypothetical protein